ncbi:MAG: hypothetical protein ACOYOV_05090 [Bacteroidales bacterium]
MKKIIFIAMIVSLFISCKTKKEITSDRSDSLVYIEKLKFDTIITPADSSWLKAWFKCDSLGNVYISELIDLKSKEINSDFNFSKGVLSYGTKRDEKKTIIESKNIYINRRIKETITITKTIVKMSMFQKIFFWIGIVLSSVGIGFIFAKIKKFI